MKHKSKPYFSWGLTAFLVLLACILTFLLLSNVKAILSGVQWFLSGLSPVLYGLAFGYLLCPIMNLVERKLRPLLLRRIRKERTAAQFARAFGIVAALGLALLAVYAIIAMLLPPLSETILRLVGDLPDYYDQISDWINARLADNPALSDLASRGLVYLETWVSSELLPNAQSFILSLTASVVNIAYGLLNIAIGIVVSIYVLASKDTFLSQSKKIVCAVLPAKRANHLMNVARYAHKTFGGFLTGKLIDSLIIGVLCFIFMSIFRMPYALLVSVIVGVTNIIPFFGPFIGAVPSAFLILLVSPMQCLYFIILVFLLQQFDGNILGPRILGDSTGLSAFWIIVSILVFGKLFGVVGMIIGVPAFAVIYALVQEAIDKRLRQRNIDPTQDFLALTIVPELGDAPFVEAEPAADATTEAADEPAIEEAAE